MIQNNTLNREEHLGKYSVPLQRCTEHMFPIAQAKIDEIAVWTAPTCTSFGFSRQISLLMIKKDLCAKCRIEWGSHHWKTKTHIICKVNDIFVWKT